MGDQRVQVTPSRLVVVGNARFVDPQLLSDQMLAFFVNVVDWLGEREALIGIPAKPMKPTMLSIPDERVSQLFYTWILVIPGACAFLGIVTWWWRRRV